MELLGKRILFIGPKFHDYEVLIREELIGLGASVDFYPERSYAYDFKLVNNYFPSRMPAMQRAHYEKILRLSKHNKYDYLFVIRGYMMPYSFVQQFKDIHVGAKAVMYQWDSELTNPFSHLIETFDVVKTFDFADSSEQNISYLPLFYTRDIELLNVSDVKTTAYDFFFMGFFFDERYDGVLKFREYCQKHDYRLKAFLYMPFTTRVKYFIKGKSIDRTIVSYQHMNRKEYLKFLSSSNIMVDVSNPKQSGLAMRVIESLACGTKVLTSNNYFKLDQKLVDSNAIKLFNPEEIKIDTNFIRSKMDSSDHLVLSIKQWLKELFD